MGTNLFSEYYNDPTKSYIYSTLVCNNNSANEIGFEINGSEGVISDNKNTLASIDFSDVLVPLEQYTTDMRIIEPYQYIYVRGVSKGTSYMSKSYGPIKDSVLADEEWMNKSSMRYLVEYSNEDNMHVSTLIHVTGDEDYSIFELAQEKMDENHIPINIEYDASYITFASTQLGFEFWIRLVEISSTPINAVPDTSIEDEMRARIMWDFEAIDSSMQTLDWKHKSSISFPYEHILRDGRHEITTIDVSVDTVNTPDYNIVVAVNEKFAELSIDASLEFSDTSNCFRIHSTRELNNFWVQYITLVYPSDNDHPLNGGQDYVNILANTRTYTPDSSYYIHKGYVYTDDPNSCLIFEDTIKYVPAIKYPNGAMKLCCIKATYPQFNAENIPETQHSLKIVHLTDRIEDYIPSGLFTREGVPTYMKMVRDVVDSHYSRFENDFFKMWSNRNIALMSNRIRMRDLDGLLWINASIPAYQDAFNNVKSALDNDIVGLSGFLSYAAIHDLWSSFSYLYIKASVDDDESSNTYNLIPSFIIYNPNSFPVTVKYMTGM